MELKIAKIISNGYGIGWADGKTFFAPFVIPGETIFIKDHIKEKGHFLVTDLEIIEASKIRRKPICDNYTVCGGCSLQHIEYTEQLEIKKEIFAELLKQNGIELSDIPVVMTPGETGIRTRTKVFIQDGIPSYRAYRSNQLVPFINCPLLNSDFIQKILSFSKKLSGDVQFEYSKITREMMPEVDSMFKVVKGEKLSLLKNSFFQSSEDGAEIMVNLLLKEVKKTDIRTAYDLFCGAGLFSRFLANAGIKTTGVEIVPDACRSFSINLENEAEILKKDAYKLKNLKKVDLIVADPPREGLGNDLIKVISESGTEKIVYISCEPSKFARDLKKFNEYGYKLSKVTLIDLFPDTPHFEVFSVLEK
ncbi:MAG TPA: methyltransferase [bacterium]|nr:methyltransferase [bacterium]HPS29152.1 methyltransferase [bacterium]